MLAPRVSSRPVIITDAPFSAIASATAEPIPDVPPVIRARLSFNSIVATFAGWNVQSISASPTLAVMACVIQ
jgi:hypothetical protein